MRLHDILDDIVLVGEEDRAQGNDAEQLARGIHHIADVDGLLVRAGAADALEGVLHRHVSLEVDELRRHQRAGSILGIFENFIDALAGVGVGVLQNALDHARGHLLDDIDGVVEIQLVEHLLELGVGKAADEHFLHIRLQLDEQLRRRLLGQQAEQQRQHLLGQIVKQVCDIGGLQLD